MVFAVRVDHAEPKHLREGLLCKLAAISGQQLGLRYEVPKRRHAARASKRSARVQRTV